MLDSVCIKASLEPFIAQLHRLRGRGLKIESDYIHAASVQWLREAIDAKIAEDQEKRTP